MACVICLDAIKGPAYMLIHVPENKMCTKVNRFCKNCVEKLAFCPCCRCPEVKLTEASFIRRQIRWIRSKYEKYKTPDMVPLALMPVALILLKYEADFFVRCLPPTTIIDAHTLGTFSAMVGETLFSSCIAIQTLCSSWGSEWNSKECLYNGVALATGIALGVLTWGVSIDAQIGTAILLTASGASMVASLFKKAPPSAFRERQIW